MARRSSIGALDPRLKGAVDAAITEGRATIDEIVAMVRAMGGSVSRSAMGRYRRGFEESLARYREAQQVAGQWVAQFQADPTSDVGRLLAEMVKTLAFQTMAAANEEEEPIGAMELSRLARAVKALTDTDRIKAELEEKVRAAAISAAAEQAERSATEAGLSAERAAQIRRDVLGVRPIAQATGVPA